MRRFFFGLLFVAGGASAYACSFPEVDFAPDDGGIDGPNGETGVPSDTGADVTTRDAIADVVLDTSYDGQVDAALLDVAVAEDAGGKVDASGCKTCDCDEDGYNRFEAGVDCGAGPYDCDDNDSRSHPEQLYLEDKPEAPMFGDWNCSGAVEKGYQENVKCDQLLLGLGCAGSFGFNTTVACGEKGRWARCKPVPVLIGLPLACTDDTATVQDDLVQPCK